MKLLPGARLLVLFCCFSVKATNAFLFGRPEEHLSSLTTCFKQRLASSSSSLEDKYDKSNVVAILRQAAEYRSVPSNDLTQILEDLLEDINENNSNNENNIPIEYVHGTFDLIFSSAVANLPIIGTWLFDGYLPNREIISFDLFDKQPQLTLVVETFPFLPPFTIIGNNLLFDPKTSTLSYCIEGKDSTSLWKILYADETIIAAQSSVTGLNLIRRIDFP